MAESAPLKRRVFAFDENISGNDTAEIPGESTRPPEAEGVAHVARDLADGPALPRSRRKPVLVMAGIAIVSAIGVVIISVNAAPSARSSEPRPPVSNSTPTTIPRYVDDGTLTAPRTYRGGRIELAPPPIGTRPRVTVDEAFANRGGYAWKSEPRTPHLMLAVATVADYVASKSDGTVTPIIDHRLVWVVTYSDVPADDIARAGNTRPGTVVTFPTTTSASAPKATGYTVLSFVDAATGKPLGASGFANESPAKCVPVRIVRTSYLSPNGEEAARPSPGAATIYQFADGNQQLVVPEDFDPLRAGDLTLFLFGFPPRPEDPAARTQWEDTYRNYRSAPVGDSTCTDAP